MAAPCGISRVGRGAGGVAFTGHLHLAPLPSCPQHVLSRAQSITVPPLCNMLLAFARLNFHPEQEDEFFSLVQTSRPVPIPVFTLWAGWVQG